MGKKRILLSGLICGLLFLFACFPVWADDNSQLGGAVPKGEGTDIVAGVVVDYMGKLRFVVLDRDTNNPIEGVSVEIYIPSLDRYVLFGLTDSNGIYELDAAYNVNSFVPDSDQYFKNNGLYAFDGASLVYLNDNTIWYRVYKEGWLTYPYNGKYILKGDKLPEIVTIKLYEYRYNGKGNERTNKPARGGSILEDPTIDIPDTMPPLGDSGEGGTETGGIPKTGVEGTFLYWAIGLIFFLLAGGSIWKLSRLDNESKETKRRE